MTPTPAAARALEIKEALAAAISEIERLRRERDACIRLLAAEGESVRGIAALTGVTFGRVGQVLRNPRNP